MIASLLLINIIYGYIPDSKYFSKPFNTYNDKFPFVDFGYVVCLTPIINRISINVEHGTCFRYGDVAIFADLGILYIIHMFFGIQGGIADLFLFLRNLMARGEAMYSFHSHAIYFLDILNGVPSSYFFRLHIAHFQEILVDVLYTIILVSSNGDKRNITLFDNHIQAIVFDMILLLNLLDRVEVSKMFQCFDWILLLGLYALNKSDHNLINFFTFYNDSATYS